MRIWWLASYPKSGNTWLRMFLSAYRNYGYVHINDPVGVSVDDMQSYFTHVVSPCSVEKLTDSEHVMLRPAALLHMTHVQNPEKPFFVKTHSACSRLGGVDMIPSGLTHGAVYVVRDPRDVAVSWAEHLALPLDETIADMARREYVLRRRPLYQHTAGWSHHVKSWLHARDFPVLVIRYEDMLAAPRDTFRAVLKFLRHEVEENLLIMSIEAARFGILQAQEEMAGFREAANSPRFFARGAAGGWRDALTPAQVARIEADHGEMMRQLGYL